jgi:hypothetical protein
VDEAKKELEDEKTRKDKRCWQGKKRRVDIPSDYFLDDVSALIPNAMAILVD